MEVECSSGTYIRTLGADIGTVLGGGASLRALRRTAVGSFTEAMANPVESVGLTDVQSGLAIYPSVEVDAEQAVTVGHGRGISRDQATGDGPWLITHDGELIAVHERIGDRIKTAWVAV